MKTFKLITALQSNSGVALSLAASILCSVLSVSVAQAAVYKKVDADGNVSFSDVPDKSAQVVNVTPLSTIPAMSPDLIKKTLGQGDTAATPAVDMSNYVLTINSPSPDQTFNRAEDAFAANVTVKPELRDGDRLVLLVDGKASNAKQDNPTVHTAEMDRGSHVFEARVVSARGKVLTAKSVTFFVQQASVRRH